MFSFSIQDFRESWTKKFINTSKSDIIVNKENRMAVKKDNRGEI